VTDLSLLLSQKYNSVDILPRKHFNVLLPEEEDWERLYEALEGMYLLVKNRKVVNSNIR